MRQRRHVLTILILCLLLACNDSAPQDSPAPQPSPSPDTALGCERQNYPCSLSEVDDAVLQHEDILSDQVLARLAEGDSAEEVAKWLSTQPEVSEALGENLAIMFRLEGGTPVWIVDVDVDAPPPAVTTGQLSPQGVVGSDHRQKRALVLNTIDWEYQLYRGYGGWTDTIAELLEATRGYAGNVSHLVNSDQAKQVGLVQFSDWQSYDLIYLLAHGAQLCGETCHTMVFSGDVISGPRMPYERARPERTTRGLTRARIRIATDDGFDVYWIYALTSDFFRQRYPGGLESTLILMSACQTMKATDLTSALVGDASTLVGWDDAVRVDTSTDVFFTLLNDMSENGVTFKDAYDALVDEGLTRGSLEQRGREIEATLNYQQRSPDLRVREVITLLTSEGEPMTDDVRLDPFLVGLPDDNRPDKLNLLVELDGVIAEDKAETFLRFMLDDQPIGSRIAFNEANPRKVDDYRYELTLRDIATGIDFKSGRSYKLTAIVDLPEGGSSRHEASGSLLGCWVRAEVSGEYSGYYEGPAGFAWQPDRGSLRLHLSDWNYHLLDESDNTLGDYQVEARASLEALGAGTFDIDDMFVLYTPYDNLNSDQDTWTAVQNTQPVCSNMPCGSATLTLTNVSDAVIRGSIRAELFGMGPYDETGGAPPPYWTVSYQAVFQALVDTDPLGDADLDWDYLDCATSF